MSKSDWFRRTTWTEQDRDDFYMRLKRSRGNGNKSQYLRIQAVHLAEAGVHEGAIELVDRLFAEFPEQSELASAHLQKAESLACLGRIDAAIQEFRSALQAERDFPNVQTNAWLDFGWFVVEKRLLELHDEVLGVLTEFGDEEEMPFPIFGYRYWAVQSIIADNRGERKAARELANRALTEAAKKHSGWRNHPKLGLVGMQTSWVQKKLESLASR